MRVRPARKVGFCKQQLRRRKTPLEGKKLENREATAAQALIVYGDVIGQKDFIPTIPTSRKRGAQKGGGCSLAMWGFGRFRQWLSEIDDEARKASRKGSFKR